MLNTQAPPTHYNEQSCHDQSFLNWFIACVREQRRARGREKTALGWLQGRCGVNLCSPSKIHAHTAFISKLLLLQGVRWFLDSALLSSRLR